MNYENEIDVVELGVASEETHGSDFQVIEQQGKRALLGGISED